MGKRRMARNATIAGVVAGVALGAALVVEAGPQAQPPQYDLRTETILTGTIGMVTRESAWIEYKTLRNPVRKGLRSPRGVRRTIVTSLTLQTEAGSTRIYLGPSAYIEREEFCLCPGDQVEITGARVTADGMDLLVARELRQGGRSLALRDASGRSLWPR